MPRPTSLSLVIPSAASPVSSAITSPTASDPPSFSQRSSKYDERKHDNKENYPTEPSRNIPTLHLQSAADAPPSPTITSLPPFPSSPKTPSKHTRDQSRSFFSNLKASKSSNRVHHMEPTIRQVPPGDTSPPQNTIYSIRKGSGSTPDLSKSTFEVDARELPGELDAWRTWSRPSNRTVVESSSQEPPIQRRPTGNSILSDSALLTAQADPAAGRKSKARFGHLLNRTKSIRLEDSGRRSKPATPIRITGPGELRRLDGTTDSGGLKTAPLQTEKDRSFRDMMGSAIRNKSADRQPAAHNEQSAASLGRVEREPVHGLTISASTVFREGTGARAHLITNLKNTSTKAADGLGKAGKGILGRIARTGSSNGKDGAEGEPYVFSTINLPLVEQTRRTRIAKRLEDSKDKTEFWMPALPWRCIE